MKWEPALAMIALLLLGFWLAFAPDVPQKLQPGWERVKFSVGEVKGALDWNDPLPLAAAGRTYLVHYRDGTTTGPLTTAQAEAVFGKEGLHRMTARSSNSLLRKLNVSSWIGLVWVSIGMAGQIIFGGRWLVQWIASEKAKGSSVPVSFWWMSLVGSVMVFSYFVWRQDFVGVLGQCSGVVIYARNIRLIAKERRRKAEGAAQA